MLGILSRMDNEEPERRPHHYQFAHKVLAGVARDMGPGMLAAKPEVVNAGMITLWNSFGAQLPAEHRLLSDGLRAELIELGGHRMMVIVLPKPIAAGEAYYTAAVQPAGADHCRYFTLEHAVNPFTAQPYTVFAEWSDDSHLNYGEGPAPDLSAFLFAVIEFLAKSEVETGGAAGPASPPSPASPAQPQQTSERRGLRKMFGR
jgi:hypothetical protein